MESRGREIDGRPRSRPALARRSCDQCRARKVGCDRASPCSNCNSARLSCTHSAVASSATAPKQRVLISAQYEQKIDDIARGVNVLLQGLNTPTSDVSDIVSVQHLDSANLTKSLTERPLVSASSSEPLLWDHSGHIIDFIKDIVHESSKSASPETVEVISSLQGLIQSLECPAVGKRSAESRVAGSSTETRLPPQEAVVAILRWAKDKLNHNRILWISQILPLDKFTEICQRVYFAIDKPSQIDLILVTGYLSYLFAEHVAVFKLQGYQEYYRICRRNLEDALSQLPLLLPASMEVIAALTIGTFNAIENSRSTIAWTLISSAADLCHRLGYHRLRRDSDRAPRAAQDRLFWTVYRMEKGISLRLGRSSNMRDAEITLPLDLDDSRATRHGRIQGQTYDRLYSPTGLSLSEEDRSHVVEAMAKELRELIDEVHVEIRDITNQPADFARDPTRVFYLQCDLVCQSSLLALILRATPVGSGSLSNVPESCVTVARDTLNLHQECMKSVSEYTGDPFIINKYINWAILHTPFVSFSILFTRAVQALDTTDLAILEGFAASLKPESLSSETITHPHRLYQLLCRAARLYIDSNTHSLHVDLNEMHNVPNSLGQLDMAQFSIETAAASDGTLEATAPFTYDLGYWYYGNQQIMSLLDDDVTF